MMRRAPRPQVVLLAGLLTLSCAALRAPRTPMPMIEYDAAGAARALVVLLPGRLSAPGDFERHGLLAAVRRARPDADIVAVDAHLGYYRAGVIRERLWRDVLQPATLRYEEIWLVGVSLGGVGALAMTVTHGEALDGVVVLAPYLGPKALIRDIQDAGGPHGWSARHPDDPIEGMWEHFRDRAAEPAAPPIFLGFGSDDRRATDHRLFAELLVPRRVVERPGGHRWPVWVGVFESLLETGALQAGAP